MENETMAKNQISFNFLWGIPDEANFFEIQIGPNDKHIRKRFQNKRRQIVDDELV